MTYELYLITNNITHKRYVGQTNSETGYLKRFDQHFEDVRWNKKHLSILHKSMKKYGREAFSIKLLMHNIEECRIDALETLWIKKLNTFYKEGPGYNMTRGGQGIHGYKHTKETRQKMSIANSGRLYTEERTQKILSTKRAKNSQVSGTNLLWRQRLSVATKKRFENQPGTMTGRHHTTEAKQKISAINSIPILAYDAKTGEFFREFSSATAATAYLIECGITSNRSALTRILKICHGQDRSAYGYVWKFVKDVTTIPQGSRGEDELPLQVHIPKDQQSLGEEIV